MMSYPGLLMVEMISLDKEQGEDRNYLDLSSDIVIMENISIRRVLFTRVVMVAINMELEDAILDFLRCRHFLFSQNMSTAGGAGCFWNRN